MTPLRLMALLVVGLGNAGCDQMSDSKKAPSPPPNHAGRYQMVADHDFGVYVLDTADGMVAKCATAMSNETWCTRATSAVNGSGPPAWIDAAAKSRAAETTEPAPDQ